MEGSQELLVVAHRGASGSAPENTLAALERARALGATWAEVDVQRTSDGVLVLVHDDDWRRTAGLDRKVAETPWEVVRALDVGSWFAAAYAAERPPRLDEALELACAGMRLDLEIKSPERHPGLGEEIVAAVRRAGVAARVFLTSFDATLVERLSAEAPDLEFGYLSTAIPAGDDPRIHTAVVHHAALEGAPDLARRLAAGRRVLAWTVDDPDAASRLAQLGVRGIVTNHPERFLPPPGR